MAVGPGWSGTLLESPIPLRRRVRVPHAPGERRRGRRRRYSWAELLARVFSIDARLCPEARELPVDEARERAIARHSQEGRIVLRGRVDPESADLLRWHT